MTATVPQVLGELSFPTPSSRLPALISRTDQRIAKGIKISNLDRVKLKIQRTNMTNWMLLTGATFRRPPFPFPPSLGVIFFPGATCPLLLLQRRMVLEWLYPISLQAPSLDPPPKGFQVLIRLPTRSPLRVLDSLLLLGSHLGSYHPLLFMSPLSMILFRLTVPIPEINGSKRECRQVFYMQIPPGVGVCCKSTTESCIDSSWLHFR
jgi:hypothetical protein